MAFFKFIFVGFIINGLDIISCITKEEDNSFKTIPEIIENNGYPCEEHFVVTEDGYILGLHRIPYGRNEVNPRNRKRRGVVFLQHGIESSSGSWILIGPGKGLGYILADNGFDVWMGNSRGNTYSRNHTSINVSSQRRQFWDFSFHEMGIYDLPACIDYILNYLGIKRLTFIGHSQGCTAFFTMCSEKPEYNHKIVAFLGLAPVSYVSYTKLPLLLALATLENHGLVPLINFLIGPFNLLPDSNYLATLLLFGCKKNILPESFCVSSSPKSIQLDMEGPENPVWIGHYPAGSSSKQFIHFAQEYNAEKFCKYNYGTSKNLKLYGMDKPPDYILKNVKVPTYLYYGQNDSICVAKDVERLSTKLENLRKTFSVDEMTHADFTYGDDAHVKVYKSVLNIIINYY